MPRKPNPKTKRYSRPRLLKSAHMDKLHPKSGLEKSSLNVCLTTSQIVGLKKLAKAHGTTLAQELDNAIDAYVLGMSQGEVRMLNALLDRLNEATAKSNKALDAALRNTKKTRTRSTRKQRPGQQR